MTRQFPLAGLLRLRQLQEDQARAEYGAANRRIGELADRRTAVLEGDTHAGAEPDSAVALRAIAAARAAQTGMLADLRALAVLAEGERDAAQAGFAAARARTLGLEKLQDRHAAAVQAEDLAAEQGVLDDLAGSLPRAAVLGEAV